MKQTMQCQNIDIKKYYSQFSQHRLCFSGFGNIALDMNPFTLVPKYLVF